MTARRRGDNEAQQKKQNLDTVLMPATRADCRSARRASKIWSAQLRVPIAVLYCPGVVTPHPEDDELRRFGMERLDRAAGACTALLAQPDSRCDESPWSAFQPEEFA